MTLSTETAKQALAITEKFITQSHDDFNIKSGKALAKLYFCASDKEGYCLNFDDIWKLCGYATKASAKRQLLNKKLRFVEGRDYKVLLNTHVERSAKPGRGGNNREDIWMTSDCFCNFASASQTDQGWALRAFLKFLTKQVKILVDKQSTQSSQINPRVQGRIAACDSQKEFTSTLKAIEYTKGHTYFKLNAMTNHKITGRTKRQIVRELAESGNLGTKKLRKDTDTHKKGDEVPKTAADITGRDYYPNTLLSATQISEKLSSKKLQEEYEKGTIKDFHDLETIHERTLDNIFTEAALAEFHAEKMVKRISLEEAYKASPEHQKLLDLRKEKKRLEYQQKKAKAKALLDRQQQQKKNKAKKDIQSYFGSNV